MNLLEDAAGSNAHEFTVSELSGAVKRNIEDQFSLVRVRGEIGRVSRPASGHLYFDLKDDRAVLAAISWKGQASKLAQRPEEGMEVIATGRMTTFPGQSKYQLIVEQIEPAGAGALMAMLEKRRKTLAAEGLFDDDRKRPLPFLPGVIGVVTSPSGAVIRDILHRLRDRFPTHVLIWPVAVQGEACAPQVSAAIRGFNALPVGGTIPRPDLIIVARGGGSLEDLWGFNDEDVVRAAAASEIPLISAVGHETDTTLLDFAADRRAPTPTAAAELAVPVKAELSARLTETGLRMTRTNTRRQERMRQRLTDLSRALGRPASLTEPARQRFDIWAIRLTPALRGLIRAKQQKLNTKPVSSAMLRQFTNGKKSQLAQLAARLESVMDWQNTRRREHQAQLHGRLESSLRRVVSESRRAINADSAKLVALLSRFLRAGGRISSDRREALQHLDRMHQTLGYKQTLKRGYAVIHAATGVIVRAEDARRVSQVQIEFADGRVDAMTQPPESKAKRKSTPEPEQGKLL